MRARLETHLAELSQPDLLDQGRLEQEMLYYIEKLDIEDHDIDAEIERIAARGGESPLATQQPAMPAPVARRGAKGNGSAVVQLCHRFAVRSSLDQRRRPDMSPIRIAPFAEAAASGP